MTDGVPGSVLASPARSSVLRALDVVRDPEIDEPVTDLGFVSSCEVSQDDTGRVTAEVHLRLPTYFCAPNFAFLMVADAYEAVAAVPGVTQAKIVLDDHFASDAINAGIAARAGFVESMGTTFAAGELDDLRATFVRKAVLAGTDRVCRPLLAAGATWDQLSTMTLGDVPRTGDLHRLRGRRAEIGLPGDDDAPLLIDVETGARVPAEGSRMYLGKARLTRVNLEANGHVCKGMLASRYGLPIETEGDE